MLSKIVNKTDTLIKKGNRYIVTSGTIASYLFTNPSLITKLSRHELRLLARPWYHNFKTLGFSTSNQFDRVHRLNQKAKQVPLFDYIKKAIYLCHKQQKNVYGVELFCADGFYANYAIQSGAERMLGIDIDKHALSKAQLMKKLLGNSDRITFESTNVFQLFGTYDFCICAGGLYHQADPFGLLKLLKKQIKTALIIQTVYSLAKSSPDYFETPAPGWAHGCRFSYTHLLKMVENSGWKILDAKTNILTGNERPEDRGSAYLLCIPKEKEL